MSFEDYNYNMYNRFLLVSGSEDTVSEESD